MCNCRRTMTPKIPRQRRYPVLYFLHGLGQNEQTLFSTGGWSVIEDLRRQHKIADFLVVAPEGKRSFYINSPGNKLRYSDFFLAGVHASHRKQISRSPGTERPGHHRRLHGRLRSAALCFRPSRTVFRRQRAERCSDHADSARTLGCRTLGYAPGPGHGTSIRRAYQRGALAAEQYFSARQKEPLWRCEIWPSTSIAASRMTSDLRTAPPPCTGNCRRKA